MKKIPKKVVFLRCSPGHSSPKHCVGEEAGFFYYFMKELDFLFSAFSSQRLSKYIDFNKGNLAQSIAHYKSNLILAESLYISLSVFEVTLRNALSRELSKMAGQSDWMTLFLRPELQALNPYIEQAKAQISRRGERLTTDKVISELTFGFWVTLLNCQYERTLWKTLRMAFPNMPKSERKRKNVSAPCNAIRRLRNRVFHHEAICWNLDYVVNIHHDLVKVLGWMNADMPMWLSSIDSFDSACVAIRRDMGWN